MNNTTFPIYTSTAMQDANRVNTPYVRLCPRDRLIPFEVKTSTGGGAVDTVKLVDCEGVKTDITDYFSGTAVATSSISVAEFTSADYIYYSGGPLNTLLPHGTYYLEINQGYKRWYSEHFSARNLYTDYLSSWANLGYNTFVSSGSVISTAYLPLATVDGVNAFSNAFSVNVGDKLTFQCDCTASGSYPKVSLSNNRKIFEEEAEELGADAMHLWLNRSKAYTFGDATYYSYSTYTGGTSDVYVAKYDHLTRTVTTEDTTENAGTDDNAHASPSIFVDSSGYIYVVMPGYTGAGTDPTKLRIIKSTNPEDITTWDSSVTIDTDDTNCQNFSYPHLMQTSGGTLVLVYRAFDTSDYGRIVIKTGSTLSEMANAPNYADNRKIIISSTNEDYPYFDSYLDSNDRFHFAYHHYDYSLTLNRDIYYAYSDNITDATPTFKDITDSTIATLWLDSGSQVYDSRPAGVEFDTCYITGLSLDSSNSPVIAYLLLDSFQTDKLRAVIYDSGWKNKTIVWDNNIGYGALNPFGREPSDGCITYYNSKLWISHLFSNSTSTYIKEYTSIDSGATWELNSTFSPATGNYTIPCYPDNIGDACHMVALRGDLLYNAAHSISFFSPTPQPISDEITLHDGVNDIELTATEAIDYAVVNLSNKLATEYSLSFSRLMSRGDFIDIKFSNTNDLIHSKQDSIMYSTGNFKQVVYLDTRLNNPSVNYVEIGEELDGEFISEQINSTYLYNIIDYISRSLYKGLQYLPMHDSIEITDEVGNVYIPDVGNVVVNIDWTTFDTGTVKIEFNDGAMDWVSDSEDIT